MMVMINHNSNNNDDNSDNNSSSRSRRSKSKWQQLITSDSRLTYRPCALSPESMTASAPSYTAFVTSLTSALDVRTQNSGQQVTHQRCLVFYKRSPLSRKLMAWDDSSLCMHRERTHITWRAGGGIYSLLASLLVV